MNEKKNNAMHPAIVLQDAYKTYTRDQDKLVPPEETLRRFHNRVKTLNLDLLDRVVRIDNGRLDIPVFMSICGREGRAVIGNKKQMGKGAFPSQAEASAVMELAERFSLFTFMRNQPCLTQATCEALAGPALAFEYIRCSVHDESPDLDKSAQIMKRIPLRWTWARNLTRQEDMLIPFDWFYAINEYNGSAAGNGTEEALLQSICEVVERHVSALVNSRGLETPAIDPASITDPTGRLLLEKFKQAGISLFLNDFTLDLGIPTISALAYDPSTFPQKSEIVWTAGTATDPQKALIRALSEIAQLAGDFNTGSVYQASGLPKIKALEQARHIRHGKALLDISNLPNIAHDNFRIEIESCLALLARKEYEVLSVDITHPRLQIPAYYSIIPGAFFRERAKNRSVALFCAKLISTNLEPKAALRELENMDQLLPGKYFVKFFQGLSCLAMQNPDGASAFFQQALEMDPQAEDVPGIYSYLGQAFKEQNRFSEALQALEKGAQHDPERIDIYNLMGFCHYKLKDHVKAIECFRKVLRLDPSSALDYANIGVNYLELGERGKALEYFRLALALDPGIDFAREHLLKLESEMKIPRPQ